MIDKMLDFIKENFPQKSAYFAGLIALIFIFALLDNFIEKFINNISFRAIIYLIICGIWFFYWLYKRNHLPSNKTGYIGLFICIKTENDKQKIRLRNDFFRRITSLVSQKNLQDKVNVVLLDNYQSEYVVSLFEKYLNSNNKKQAEKVLKKIRVKTKGHFFVYGYIKERKDVDDRYYLDLEALVTHAPIPTNIHKNVVQNLLSVWYRHISFQEKIEFKGFMFVADTIFIAAQYTVGIAALVSGDVSLALELHTGLNNDAYFLKFNKLPPNLKYVKKKLTSLIAVEYFFLAQKYFGQKDFLDAEKYLEQSLSTEVLYGAYLLKSIIEFSYKNNPAKALKCIHKAKKLAKNDGTWRYNKGFLLMYMEKFEKALKIYEEIADISFVGEEDVLAQIYKFNEDFIEKNRKKIQALFIVGFLKYKKDSNYPDALEYFEKFILESKSKDNFNILTNKAKIYWDELKKLMNL